MVDFGFVLFWVPLGVLVVVGFADYGGITALRLCLWAAGFVVWICFACILQFVPWFASCFGVVLVVAMVRC